MTWSYTRKVKEELAQVTIGSIPCCWAELWGMSGQVSDPYQDTAPWLRSGAAFITRRGYRIMKPLGLCPTIRMGRHQHRMEFSLWGEDVPPPDIEQSVVDCPPSFLRGAFFVRGYLSEVDRPLHWEISTTSQQGGEFLMLALELMGLRAHITERRGVPLVYLKDREQVAHVLASMGAHRSVLAIESQSVVRSMKNQVNRLVNSETANMKRTVESALKDAERLEQLRQSGEFGVLPPDLRQLAHLRIAHPDWTFEDLGQHLSPPVSKSAVNHRLRKLRQWLENPHRNR